MSRCQEDLRERLKATIASWTEEWDCCSYDLLGVLNVMQWSIMNDLPRLTGGEDDE